MSISDTLPNPIFVSVNGGGVVGNTYNSNATFYRTGSNSNVQINVPIGPLDVVYVSPDTYLPSFVFNSTRLSAQVIWQNDVNAQFLQTINANHNLIIQYKLTKDNGTNFANQREVRAYLVNAAGNPYDDAIYTSDMPDSGSHSCLLLNQFISQTIGDIIKLKFVIIQDTTNNDETDSLLTIFKISWNISG